MRVVPEDGAPLSVADLPLLATIAGTATAIVTLEEYRRLLAKSVDRSAFEGASNALRRRPPALPPLASTIERDPEVAAFLASEQVLREATATPR